MIYFFTNDVGQALPFGASLWTILARRKAFRLFVRTAIGMDCKSFKSFCITISRFFIKFQCIIWVSFDNDPPIALYF